MATKDRHTLELFDWQPPTVTVGYDAQVAGHGRLDNRIARSVARALKETDKARRQIAEAMSVFLGRKISKDILDKWSSEAADSHRIPLDAYIALIDATDCPDLLGLLPGMFGYAVVPERYAGIIELHLIEEHEREVAARKSALQAKWGSRR